MMKQYGKLGVNIPEKHYVHKYMITCKVENFVTKQCFVRTRTVATIHDVMKLSDKARRGWAEKSFSRCYEYDPYIFGVTLIDMTDISEVK